MSNVLTFLASRWLPITLIVGSLLAVLYVYINRIKLLQIKALKRRSKS